MSRQRTQGHGFYYPGCGQMALYPTLWEECLTAVAFDRGVSDRTASDWSGRGNDGTAVNCDLNKVFPLEDGRHCFAPDGANDYVTFPQLMSLGASFSVSLWYRVPSGRNSGTWLRHLGSGFTIYQESSLGLTFYVESGANWIQRGVGTSFYGATWRHLYCEFSGGAIARIAVDGIDRSLLGSGGGSITTVTTTVALTLDNATYPNAVGSAFDDVRVYSRVLKSNESQLLAVRRGIAYELAPRRRSAVQVAAASGFRAAWVAQRSSILGGGFR